MQTKDAQKTGRSREGSTDWPSTLFDFAPFGYFTLNDEGVIVEANYTSATLLGADKNKLIDKPFSDFIIPEDRGVFSSNLRNALESRTKQSCQLRMVKADGSQFTARVESVGVVKQPGLPTEFRIALTDVYRQRRSENKKLLLAEIVEHSRDAIIGKNLDGTITSWNPAAERMYGYTESEVLGKPISLIIPDDRQHEVPQFLRKIEMGESIEGFETRRAKKDGSEIHMSLTISPIRDTEGTIVGASTIARDITDRKRTEEALRESERMLKSILSASPVGIGMAQDRVMKWVNEDWVKMFGFENEQECIGQSARIIYPSDRDYELTGKKLYAGLKPGTVTETDARFRRRDGSVFDAHIRMQILRTAGAENITISAITNISERKRWERELQHILRRFYTILSSSYAGLLLVTNDNIVEFVNQAFCDLFDLKESPDTLRGLTAVELLEKIRDVYTDPARIQEGIKKIVAENVPLRGQEVAARGGRTYLVDYIPIVIGGRPYGRVWSHTDITDRKRAEQERENLRAELLQSQKMEAVGALAMGIAHDFSIMLTDIFHHASEILANLPEESPGRASAQSLIKTTQDAAELIHRIRIFSRKADMNLVPMDLSHQIDRVKKLLSRALPETIELDIRLAEDPVIVNADPNQMVQLLMNLAINAREAMPRGGALTIQTEIALLDEEHCRLHAGVRPGRYAILTISDTGRGIEKDIVDRIFDPFFSTKGGDVKTGTGLGLSVVQGIVEQHGGHITVESEIGQGTTFKIHLPTVVPWNVESSSKPPRAKQSASPDETQ